MADIITNLHPDGDENTNLYPNIKKENIPSKSISTDKLDDNVLSLIGSLKPSGTDTSTNILAFTSNKGIYVATDNGHWYYWNGSAYADGGLYQSQFLDDNSITYNLLDVDIQNALPKIEVLDEINPTDNLSGVKPYYNTQYNLGALESSSGQTTKIYPVTSGKKYLIKCQVNSYTGIDATNPVAFIGTSVITTTTETTTFKQGILIETAPTQPTDYDIEFTANFNGYIYIRNAYHFYELNYKLYNVSETIGLIKNGSLYTHFMMLKNGKYLFRDIKPLFINNLIDLYRIYIGHFEDNTPVLETLIGTSSSDTIGPISIHRGDVDSWTGQWSGGGHGKTISGVEYPTAQQTSLNVYCDNNEITEDGIYYGDVTIIEKNNLYYPQTITGNDLSQATIALKETRIFKLTNKMKVNVTLEGVNNGYSNIYYGCQINTYNMNKVILPNNEKLININPSNAVFFNKPEYKICCLNSNIHYDVTLDNSGLGTYAHNDGTNTSFLYGNVATFNKIYYQLIANSTSINSNKYFYWSATYDYYLD